MAQTVQLPNGDTLEFPDDMDPRLVEAHVKRHVNRVDPDSGLGGTLSFAGMDTGIKISPALEAGIVAAGKGLTRFGHGAQKLYYDARQQPEKSAALDQQVENENSIYEPLAQKYPKATMGGEIAPWLAVPGGPLAMGAAGFLDYAPTMNDRAKNALFAFGGAKLGQAIGRGFGAPSMGKGANKYDIPLTVGQNSGNKVAQVSEAVLENIPLGGKVRAARNATTEAFWRAVSREFGEDATKLTPEMLGRARDKIGNEIGNIASRNKIAVDPDLFKGLQAAAARAQQELTEDEAKLVNTQLQKIWRQMDPTTGAIPGTLYKATQSKLGELAKNRGGTMASVLGDVRTALREAMTRSVSPDDSAAWLKANEQYFNLQQVANATKRTPGELSPASLLTQVNQAQKSAKFGGGNDLAELAQFAQQKIGSKVPNSGTAQRDFYQRLFTEPGRLAAGAGLLGGSGYAASQYPEATAAGVALPLIVARFLAGKPVSPTTRKLLEASGAGLLATQF